MEQALWKWLIGGLIVSVAAVTVVAQTQGKDAQPLKWQPLKSFETLVAGEDYAANEVLAIYNVQPTIENIKSALNPKGNLARVANSKGMTIIDAIPIPARASDPSGAKSKVCGRLLIRVRFTKQKDVQEAVGILNQQGIRIFGSGDALYGVAPDGYDLPHQNENDDEQDLWGLEATTAPNVAETGKGVRIAVLDTGVSRIAALDVENGKNYVIPKIPTNNTNDDFTLAIEGHGTGVAGVAAGHDTNGQRIGIAPDAEIVPVKVCRRDGHCTDSSVVLGVCYAISKEARARVLNVSLGSFINSPLLAGAIHDANLEKALVVASAGNTRSLLSTDRDFNRPVFPAAFSNTSPYNLENLMSISSVDRKLRYAWYATAHATVDMVAPGTFIGTFRRDGSTYTNNSGGTSYAAPFVSGTAALMFSKNSSLSPANAKAILKRTADPKGCNQVQAVDSCGTGLLQVEKALNATP